MSGSVQGILTPNLRFLNISGLDFSTDQLPLVKLFLSPALTQLHSPLLAPSEAALVGTLPTNITSLLLHQSPDLSTTRVAGLRAHITGFSKLAELHVIVHGIRGVDLLSVLHTVPSLISLCLTAGTGLVSFDGLPDGDEVDLPNLQSVTLKGDIGNINDILLQPYPFLQLSPSVICMPIIPTSYQANIGPTLDLLERLAKKNQRLAFVGVYLPLIRQPPGTGVTIRLGKETFKHLASRVKVIVTRGPYHMKLVPSVYVSNYSWDEVGRGSPTVAILPRHLEWRCSCTDISYAAYM